MTATTKYSLISTWKAKPLSEKIFPAFVVIWLMTCSAIIGALSLGHVVALPLPETSTIEKFKTALLAYRESSSDHEFIAHILAADCSCTQSLTNHLLENGPRTASDELILFVGESPELEAAANSAGFRFAQIKSTELTAMGLESAPVLAIFDSHLNLSYLGGYYDHPAAVRPLDLTIRDSIAREEYIEPLPIFGCATSPRLQEAFDPLGIIYK